MLKVLGRIFLSLSLLLVAGAPAMASSTLARILSQKVMKVGLVPGWPKFLVLDPQTHQYRGFLADDLKNFEAKTGIKIEWVATTWGGIVAGLQSGKFDVMVGGAITPERAAAVAFSNPYAYFYTSALTKPDNKATSLADLDKKGKILTVVAGTAMQSYARRHVKNARLESMSDSSSAVLDVMQGRADAYIGDSFTNNVRAKERPSELKIVKFKPEETEWGGLAFGVRYEDTDILALLNAYITAMKLEKWYYKLTATYDLPVETPVGP